MIGLVLEGGGAKGAYHIGAYRALTEVGIEISGVVGTSIGAINGAIIAQGDGARAWDLWADMTNSDVFDIDRQLDRQLRREGLTLEKVQKIASLLSRIFDDGGIDTTKIRAFIETHIDEARVRRSDIDFGLVTVSLTHREPLELMAADIPEGELAAYILASASLPGFKTDKVDGQQFIDGGVWNNLPLSLLVDRGYDTLIAVRTNAIGRVPAADLFGVSLVEIRPSADLGPLLDFNQSTEQRNLMLGYLDTLRIYRHLRGGRYFIEPHPDPEWGFQKLCAVDDDRIIAAGELLGIPAMAPRRMLFERVIPKLAAVFGMDDGMDYDDLLFAVYEAVADKVALERLRLYPAETFVEEIRTRYRAREEKVPRWTLELAKSDPLWARLVKEELLEALLGIFFR